MARLILDSGEVWQPLVDGDNLFAPTPQAQALESPADELFYGGAAGGGKSDLLIGAALTRHRRSIVFRREFKQIKALEDRVQEILGSRGGYNAQDRRWRLGEGRMLEFGACQHEGDEEAWQGRPHDLKAFDEITHFTERQYRFLTTWLRTTETGQRCRVIAAGNPPTGAEGDWVVRHWGPWLDGDHPRPARPGELRWYAVIDGKDTEVDDGRPFDWKGETIKPKSRTFIPSRIEDNPYLLETGYKATLQALPEPLRSRMLEGSFKAGREDDPWQVIPSAWVVAAQERWRSREKPKSPMTTLGLDPARGGRDETVMIARHDNWFDAPLAYPGADTPDGPAVAALAVAAMRNGCGVVVDSIGIGASVYDHLAGAGIACLAFNGSERSTARDRTGSMGFINKRAEWWWRMREALDPAHGVAIALPPDTKLRADLCAPRWRLSARGIQIEAKEEIIARIGRSPDRGDAATYALCDEIVVQRAWGAASPAMAETQYDPHEW
ncbi:MAG: terminase family protein [Alphaproteobacteria bacterium]|nr:terminase family protein [Alphaproteobacteria bacterium]